MTIAAVHASLAHLIAGQERNKAAISDAINAIVSAHQHGGTTAFDDRVAALRSAVTNVFATMDAIHDTARVGAGLPPEPRSEPVVEIIMPPIAQPVEPAEPVPEVVPPADETVASADAKGAPVVVRKVQTRDEPTGDTTPALNRNGGKAEA